MTQIPYIDEAWSPITGCSGRGCKVQDNCWARDMVRRFPAIHGWDEDTPYRYVRGESSVQCAPLPFSTVQFHPDRLDKPLHWRKPRRIGVCFTGDIADNQVPYAWQFNIFSMVRRCPQHQFFFLTKQIFNLKDAVANWCHSNPWPANAWSGVSICDQEDADRMIPELLRIPGKHWVSWEPMLGLADLFDVDGSISLRMQELNPREINFPADVIDWLVLGCESGKKRRPCPIEWMVVVVEQCRAAGVPVYVKQLDIGGKVVHDINLFPEALKVRELP